MQGQPEMTQTALTLAFVWHARVVTSLGQDCDIETHIVSAQLNDRNIVGTSPIYHTVYRAPWGRGCHYHRAEHAERETRHRRHGVAQAIGTAGIRAPTGCWDGAYRSFCG